MERPKNRPKHIFLLLRPRNVFRTKCQKLISQRKFSSKKFFFRSQCMVLAWFETRWWRARSRRDAPFATTAPTSNESPGGEPLHSHANR